MRLEASRVLRHALVHHATKIGSFNDTSPDKPSVPLSRAEGALDLLRRAGLPLYVVSALQHLTHVHRAAERLKQARAIA